MIIPPEPVAVRPNATVTFSCLAWSYGRLVYEWNKSNSSTLPYNSMIGCSSTLSEFSILTVQVMDEGYYCCGAFNERGVITKCAWLEVDSKI